MFVKLWTHFIVLFGIIMSTSLYMVVQPFNIPVSYIVRPNAYTIRSHTNPVYSRTKTIIAHWEYITLVTEAITMAIELLHYTGCFEFHDQGKNFLSP